MSDINLEIGKKYKIRHRRKGTFTALITKQDDTWTTGKITSGKTDAMLEYNVCQEGDEVTFRTEWVEQALEIIYSKKRG